MQNILTDTEEIQYMVSSKNHSSSFGSFTACARIPIRTKNFWPIIDSIKVHLMAISIFHQNVESLHTFSHPVMKYFLTGLQNLYPEIREPTLAWDLTIVVKALTCSPFESLVMCSLLYLLMKIALLITITSARRVGEIGPPSLHHFLQRQHHYEALSKILIKISSSFHVNQLIHLPTFYLKPPKDQLEAKWHTLDVRRAFSFYLDRTKGFRKSPRLFVSIAECSKGTTISTDRLS